MVATSKADYALSFDPGQGAWTLLDGPVIDHTRIRSSSCPDRPDNGSSVKIRT
jgi:hypothetical protein